MVRARIWFKCAAMHDPVSPIIVQPAVIGWEAKRRVVNLQIERAFDGEELIKRMKGWITVDPLKVIDSIRKFGRLKVLDDRILVVEFEEIEDMENLHRSLREQFGEEIDLEAIKK